MDELNDDPKVHKKNNKMNVHLQPLDHNPQARGSSVPPMSHLSAKGAGGAHPLFAPSPNVRGGNGVRLESIDHVQHMVKGLSN